MLKVKHEAIQVLSMRTRAVATLMIDSVAYDKYGDLLAKGSVSPPEGTRDRNRYMVDLYRDRYPGQKVMTRPFVSVRDQMIHERDVVRLERKTTMNLDFDMKRMLVGARMVAYPGGEHVAFDTAAWPTLEEAELARDIYDVWRKKHTMKTLPEHAHWLDYYLSHRALRLLRRRGVDPGLQVTSTGSLGVLQRIFLRAWSRREWGVERDLTQEQVAAIVTDAGCETTVFDVKNARKGKLVERVVAQTEPAKAMFERLRQAFPGLDAGRFFFDE
jgi:hypothetical protein